MKRVLYIIAVIVLAVFFYPAYGETRYKPLAVRAGLLSISMLQADDKGRVDQLALRRVFDCFKIPYDIIKSMEEIEKYRVVYLSGPLDNRTLDPKLANQLYGYVEGGGTLIAAGEIGNRLFSLFGVEKAVPSRKRYRLTFSGEDPSLRYINRPEESTISLGNGEMHIYDEVIWTIGYHTDGGPTVLARFEDEMPGFLTGRYGRGKTYLLGISYTDSVLVPQIGKDYEAQRLYVTTATGSFWKSLRGDDFGHWLALFGLGNLFSSDQKGAGVTARIENPALPLAVVGISLGLYEIVSGTKGTINWSIAEDGDLTLAIAPQQ